MLLSVFMFHTARESSLSCVDIDKLMCLSVVDARGRVFGCLNIHLEAVAPHKRSASIVVVTKSYPGQHKVKVTLINSPICALCLNIKTI